MIDLEGVTVAFKDVIDVSEVDLRTEDGEFLTVVGPSGCGKTTLLRAIGGLEEPTEGEVRVDGDAPSVAQGAARLGFVFQNHTLLPWKSALENVTFLREMAGKEPNRKGARELLARVGLAGFEDANPRELSGGMCQRVSIARAIHLGADVLLMTNRSANSTRSRATNSASNSGRSGDGSARRWCSSPTAFPRPSSSRIAAW